MGLSIFSFDLAALINSLSTAVETAEAEIAAAVAEPPPALPPPSAAAASTAGAPTTEEIIGDILLASSAAVSAISPDEILKKTTAAEPAPAPAKTIAPAAPKPVDEAYKKAIEALIKSLQTSVVHAYQSTDIINESVALRTLSDAARRHRPTAFENSPDRTVEERKRREQKLDELREDLKKARFKINAQLRAE